jgi:hypothetical protein
MGLGPRPYQELSRLFNHAEVLARTKSIQEKGRLCGPFLPLSFLRPEGRTLVELIFFGRAGQRRHR